MPELPEVETLVRGVRDNLVNKCFNELDFFRRDIRELIPVRALKNILIDQKILAVTRRGKYMLIQTNKGALGVHLGMTGRFVAAAKKDKIAPHTHAIFRVNSKLEYRFIDARRFGRLFDINPGCIDQHPYLAQLGVEPLMQKGDLGRHLFDSSRRRSQGVKVFLMDHMVVVGVGNIYASETLWRARIHPEKKAKDLTLVEYEVIALQIVNVLEEAILAGGTTFRDYRNQDDKPGQFQMNLAVYGCEAKPCIKCESLIEKVTQSGRSTFFCPRCQPF